MKPTHISLTDAKQRLGELVKRSAYGGERFVIELRGKPVAELKALAGDADTGSVEGRRLGMLRQAAETYDIDEMQRESEMRVLEEVRRLREKIFAESGPIDVAELIREMKKEREERDERILGLR